VQIDENLISYLEDLSFISLSTDERTKMAEDMQSIINGISSLKELNTDNVPDCIQPIKNVNILRNDEANSIYDRELLLKNAPFKNEEFFIAPKIME